jgi:formylglycine-generating enzyme required for sulfatase activity
MVWQSGQFIRNDAYKILRQLGYGGFGITYLAQDTALNCPVVIKSPHDYQCDDPRYSAYLDRFTQEGQRLANLARHPHIVRVSSFFREESTPCLVMDFIEGETLLAKIEREGSLPEEIVVPWIVSIAEALSKVHQEGLVHRDAHPANIMIQSDGHPVLIDFGIALEIQPFKTTTMAGLGGHDDFAPYEQVRRKSGIPHPNMDIYCLAATLYYGVTGQTPDGATDRHIAILEGKDCLVPPKAIKSEISDRIHHAILIGMEMEPEDRPESMDHWITLLTTDDGLMNSIYPPTREELALKTLEFETVELDETAQIVATPVKSIQYLDEILAEDLTLRMVIVPGGSFMMGSPENELHSYQDERPQHQVTVPDFAIGQLVITQSQWAAVSKLPKVKQKLNSTPSNFKGDDRPVERINWDEATEFCNRLAKYTRRPYRLPSEAEWEYACRAGTTTPFNIGPTIATDFANYRGLDEDRGDQGILLGNYDKGPKGRFQGKTVDATEFPPNSFGLYQMHGNIWEWCMDHWHSGYESAPIDASAWLNTNLDVSAERVIRGGSWSFSPQGCRSACRGFDAPDNRNNLIGFRVVFSLRPQASS